MMVATGLPITTQAPPTSAQPAADAPPETPAGDGGFLGTLMQLLTPQDPADVAGAGAAGAVAQLLDDAAGDAPDDAPLPDAAATLVAPIVFPVQPADIRAAQQLARQVGDGSDAMGALTDATAAGPPNGLVDAESALLDRLGSGTNLALQGHSTDPSAVGLQGALSQPSATDLTAATRAAADASTPRQIHTPVGTPGWSDELGAQLHLMADKGHTVASLRLSPEHLGPLEVQISVQDNQASVWFGATNGDTRAALEQALPRLREMFAAQGMSLMQSGVFNQSPRDPGRQAAQSSAHGVAKDGAVAADPGGRALARRGLVDAYA